MTYINVKHAQFVLQTPSHVFLFSQKDKCAYRVISVYTRIPPSHEKFAVEKRQTKPQKPNHLHTKRDKGN